VCVCVCVCARVRGRYRALHLLSIRDATAAPQPRNPAPCNSEHTLPPSWPRPPPPSVEKRGCLRRAAAATAHGGIHSAHCWCIALRLPPFASLLTRRRRALSAHWLPCRGHAPTAGALTWGRTTRRSLPSCGTRQTDGLTRGAVCFRARSAVPPARPPVSAGPCSQRKLRRRSFHRRSAHL
jgi:hypothetical protein